MVEDLLKEFLPQTIMEIVGKSWIDLIDEIMPPVLEEGMMILEETEIWLVDGKQELQEEMIRNLTGTYSY